jgi:hypothetical protein
VRVGGVTGEYKKIDLSETPDRPSSETTEEIPEETLTR